MWLLNFIHFPTPSGNTFLIRLRRGRRGRRLLCGWTQRFQKGTSLFGWFATFQNGSLQLFYSVDLQLFQRCYILYVKVSPSAQVLFDSRLWFNTEIFSRAPFLNIVFQIWAYITFFKRAQGVLGADRHLCFQMLIHKSLMFTASHLICDRFSALRAGFSTSSLRCTF